MVYDVQYSLRPSLQKRIGYLSVTDALLLLQAIRPALNDFSKVRN